MDYNIILKMNKKLTTLGKLQRKLLRAIKKDYIDLEKALKKDPQYNSRAF